MDYKVCFTYDFRGLHRKVGRAKFKKIMNFSFLKAFYVFCLLFGMLVVSFLKNSLNA